MGRIMALDFGTKRIGVALSDPAKIIAHEYPVLPAARKTFFKKLDELIRDREVEKILVGLPKTLSGDLGEIGARSKAFAEELRQKYGIPAELIDERFTTQQASHSGRPGKTKRTRSALDSLAAQLLLQGYLDGMLNRAKEHE
ncbi:MAG: Holliday junction resolvase RuvX [Candidatus Doudnabacteria bacterium]|nr:Holliday junction resolvase RuvX [Candidatus Doudnabacteria bacterium]